VLLEKGLDKEATAAVIGGIEKAVMSVVSFRNRAARV
jgi:hypothetical protein